MARSFSSRRRWSRFCFAALSMLLFVRGGLLSFHQWVSSDLPPLTNVHTSGYSPPSSSPLPKLSTPSYLSAVCSTGCSRSFFFGRSGTISSPHSTRAGSYVALRFCSAQLSSSSIYCWPVCIVPKVVGSSEWQEPYCKELRSARSTRPPLQQSLATSLSLLWLFT